MTHRLVGLVAASLSMFLWAAPAARAHCDALDSPVVLAAKKALETGDIKHVLIWVLPQNEAEVREAFAQARAMRALNDDARKFADRYFFETAVRIHRAGEKEPYTGLKAAGEGITPAMRLADQALEEGSAAKLEAVLIESLRHQLHERFFHAVEHKKKAGASVDAGREFVRAYAEFMHVVERLEEAGAAKHRE